MADGTWDVRDSPIFWWTAATPTPGRGIGGYTSYTLGLTLPDIGALTPPEEVARIYAGDRRYLEGRP